jgi:phage terminase small subunit
VPALKNERQERFCQEVVNGKSPENAHAIAGYARNRSNAHILRRKKHIQERISELFEKRDTIETTATAKAIEKLAITKEAILSELAKIAFANMQDYMKVGPDGAPTLNFKDLTRDQAAALVEITVEEFRDGRTDAREVRRVKFKLGDKKGALVDLGKHFGMFIERHEVGEPGEFARMSDAELSQALLEQAEKLEIELPQHLLTYQPVKPEDDGEAE